LIPYCRAFNVNLVIYYYSSLLNTFGMFIEHTKNLHIHWYVISNLLTADTMLPKRYINGIEPQSFGLQGRCSTIKLFVPNKNLWRQEGRITYTFVQMGRLYKHSSNIQNRSVIFLYYMRSRTLHEYTILRIRYMFGV
jgi:hypothetical protein